MCPLHTAGTRLDNANTLKFVQGIYDYSPSDAYTICNFASYQDSFFAVQFIKDMEDCLQFRKG